MAKQKTSLPARHRDADGLMLRQRRLLSTLARGVEWREALAEEGIVLSTAQKWIRTDQAFQDAYDTLFSDSSTRVKEMIAQVGPKTVTVLEEALEATKVIQVEGKCGHCNKDVVLGAEVPDHAIRLRGTDTVLRVTGVLIDRRQIDSTVAVLSLEESLAVASVRAGRSIPPAMMEALRQKNALPALPEGRES